MQVETPAFPVREESFDLKTFPIPVTGFFGQFQIGDQENGFFVPFTPLAR